jgi:hypothetical protein
MRTPWQGKRQEKNTNLTQQGDLTMSKRIKFVTRRGDSEVELEKAIETCKASQVVMEVIEPVREGAGLPEGLKLQHAPSYNGYFVAKKGKNACGFFQRSNVLVVNAIKDELKKKGYDTFKPQASKKYEAMDMTDKDETFLHKLASDIRGIHGIAPVDKKEAAEPVKVKAKTKKNKVAAVAA